MLTTAPSFSPQVRSALETFGHLLYRFVLEDAPTGARAAAGSTGAAASSSGAAAASGTGAAAASGTGAGAGAAAGGAALTLSISLDEAKVPLAVTPLSLVTLSEAERAVMGIPISARRFAFVYPLDELDTALLSRSQRNSSSPFFFKDLEEERIAAALAAAAAAGEWTCEGVLRAVRARMERIPTGARWPPMASDGLRWPLMASDGL